MRLLTHNMLKCNIRGVENGYPLQIEVISSEVVECPFDSSLVFFCSYDLIPHHHIGVVNSMLKKLDFNCLKLASITMSLGFLTPLDHFPEEGDRDEAFLRSMHNLLFEIHIIEGYLICPQTGDNGRLFSLFI